MKTFYFILLLIASPVHALQFQAPFTDTRWQVVESPLECSLSQKIVGFGEAKFIRKTGGPLSLIFTSKSYPSIQTNVSFEIAEAPWQNVEERLHIIAIPVENNQMKFTLTGERAKKILTYVQEGKFSTLRYKSHNAIDEIDVLLSTVHLRDVMPAFKQCLQSLHPDTFDDIRRLTIHFDLEQAELGDAAKTALTKIADYVKIDESIKRISIAGYTDNHGRRRLNIPLSEARAIVVKKFLMEQEIPEKLITTSFHREFTPAKTNKTQKGRAINRRAEIEVLR